MSKIQMPGPQDAFMRHMQKQALEINQIYGAAFQIFLHLLPITYKEGIPVTSIIKESIAISKMFTKEIKDDYEQSKQ